MILDKVQVVLEEALKNVYEILEVLTAVPDLLVDLIGILGNVSWV